MDGLASTAIYLASSLSTAQTPRTVAPLPMAAPIAAATIAVPAVRHDAAAVSADAVAGANPFVLARRRGAKSLAEAIAEEVRRDARGRLTDDAGSTSSFDPDRAPGEDPDLSEDVTAAHDARIDVIRRRIDEVRLEEPSAPALLDKLSARLRMALAARRLAVAREAIGHLPVDCPADPDACRPAPSLAAADTVPDHVDSRHGRPHRSAASRRRPPAALLATAARSPEGGTASTAAGRSTGPGARRLADAHRDLPRRSPDRVHRGDVRLAASVLPATRHGAGDVAAEDASAHARRLLAAARRLLEDDGVHRSRPDVKLAGLLHWDGSETWSLADYSRSAA